MLVRLGVPKYTCMIKLLGRRAQTNLRHSETSISTEKCLSEEFKILHFFSDKCARQIKNLWMAQFLNSITASGRFLKIHHHFPERTQLIYAL
jgi:hypothetical protein